MSKISAGLSQKVRSLLGLQSQPELISGRYVNPMLEMFPFLGVRKCETQTVGVSANGVVVFTNASGKTMLLKAFNFWITGTFNMTWAGVGDGVTSIPLHNTGIIGYNCFENEVVVPDGWTISVEISGFAVAGNLYMDIMYRLVDFEA